MTIPETTISEQDLQKLEVGNAEPESSKKLEAKDVVCTGISVKQVAGKAGKPNWESVNVSVKHPDKQEDISISKVKIERDGNLKIVSISLDKDKDGKIAKWSSLAIMLSYYNCKLSELKEKTLKTVLDSNGYLAIKAY